MFMWSNRRISVPMPTCGCGNLGRTTPKSYTYDLCITAQYSTLSQVEMTVEETLGELTDYSRKTVCVSILTNRKLPHFIYTTERQTSH